MDTNTPAPKSDASARDHLANERTFLAWVRTSVGLMAFGFVVVKFSLFVRQLSLLLHKEISVSQGGFSSIVGIFIVAFGILIGLFSYMRYVTVERQIEDNNYRPSRRLSLLLVTFVCVVGVALVVYLIRSVSY